VDEHRRGENVTFETSYGASGDQSRAVEAGKQADYVHFSLEGDVTRLVKAGLVAEDWNAGPTKGIVSDSVVVLVVRKGNPKNIQGWDDIVKPTASASSPPTPDRRARPGGTSSPAGPTPRRVRPKATAVRRGRQGVHHQVLRERRDARRARVARPRPRSRVEPVTYSSPTRTSHLRPAER
jgi:hypothetical protein